MRYVNVLFLVCCALGLHASDVLRQVNVYAAPPLHPAVSASESRRLHVGRMNIMVDEAETALLDYVGNWVQGRLRPVFRVNGSNQKVDVFGNVTADQTKWVILGFDVIWAGVSLRDEAGNWTTQAIVDNAVPAKDQTQPFNAYLLNTVGEVYWYEGAVVRIIDIRDGTLFGSSDDVQRFQRQDLFSTVYDLARTQGVPNGAIVTVNNDWSLYNSPTRMMNLGTVHGATFGVVTFQRNGYTWYESEIMVDGAASTDLYRLEGKSIVVGSALGKSDGSIAWTFAREPMSRYQAVGFPAQTHDASILTEPERSQYLALLNMEQQEFSIISEAEDISTVGGQDTQALIDNIKAGQRGTAQEQTDSIANRDAISGAEAFSTDAQGNIVLNDSERYTDPETESIRADTSAGLGSSIGLHMQQNLNEIVQITPEVTEPVEGDALAMQSAIYQVEAELYPQTPTSLPLRGAAPPRYAEMHPAGWLPSYLEGAPIPGDGDNPEAPLPLGIETGAPCYDLDGDGDLDRFLSSDPYDNGFNELVLEWNVDVRKHTYSAHHTWYWKNNFAVWCGTKGKPESRKLMFVGMDPVLYVEKKSFWGTNYYSFSLKNILDPVAGLANTYRFGLRYIGDAPADTTPDEPDLPTPYTVNWSTTQDVVVGGNTITFPLEQGSETAFCYETFGEDPDLIGETFSEAGYVPRATAGKPLYPTKYVRQIVTYTIQGGVAVPAAPVISVVYFPAGWNESMIVADPIEAMPSASNTWEWDYQKLGDGMPYNYQRGHKFPRGVAKGVQLNLPEVIARYGGAWPIQPTSSLIASREIDFTVKEVAEDAPILLEVTDDPLDPNRAINEQRYADWVMHRSDKHAAFDSRTDRSATVNLHGHREYDIVQGAGFYVIKGQKVHFTSAAEQKILLEKMWLYDMEQPQTVYSVLHQDNDTSKPLLNQARAIVDADAEALLHPVTGKMNIDLRSGEANQEPNVLRRNELKETFWMFFSAARGREHELEMVQYAPKNTKLYCVEWDDLNAVQSLLVGRDVTFVQSDEEERKLKGEVLSKIYGKVYMEGRLDSSGKTFGRVLDSNAAALSLTQLGRYIFMEKDMLYDKPANGLQSCALLEDEQYGSPRSEQWISNHTMQFRHPMALFYDDRWSSVVAAYGSNADPRKWCAKWDDYAAPVIEDGVDACRVNFENWSSETGLVDLYDSMHAGEFEAAKVGDVVLPPRPNAVSMPVKPKAPDAWSGGSLEPPNPQPDPGIAPTPPIPPWDGLPGYTGLTTEEAVLLYLGAEPAPKYDLTQKGWLRVVFPNRTYSGTPTISNWIYSGSSEPLPVTDLSPIHPTSPMGKSALLFGFVPSGTYFHNITASDDMTYQYLNSSTILGHRYTGYTQNISIPAGEVLMHVRGATSGFGGGRHYPYHHEQRTVYARPRNRTVTVQVNDTYASIAHPMTAAYYAYWVKSDGVRRYQEALIAYQPLLLAWQDADLAYRRYLDDLGSYDDRLDAYSTWRIQYDAAYAAYQAEMASYEVNLQRFNAYKALDDEWVAANALVMDAQNRWQAYLRTRANWVYLVSARIAEPGVLWEDIEPTGDAFAAWKNLESAGPCRN